jgi:hypothetical protein
LDIAEHDATSIPVSAAAHASLRPMRQGRSALMSPKEPTRARTVRLVASFRAQRRDALCVAKKMYYEVISGAPFSPPP